MPMPDRVYILHIRTDGEIDIVGPVDNGFIDRYAPTSEGWTSPAFGPSRRMRDSERVYQITGLGIVRCIDKLGEIRNLLDTT